MTRAAACPLPATATAPAPGAAGGASIDCPMCGLVFTAGGTVCAGCPLHAACDLVRCPRCAYTFPARSRVVELFRRLFRRRSAADAAGGARTNT